MRYALLFVILLPVAAYGYTVEVEIGRQPKAPLFGAAAGGDRDLLGEWTAVELLPPGMSVVSYEITETVWTAVEGGSAAAGDTGAEVVSPRGHIEVDLSCGDLLGYNVLTVSARPAGDSAGAGAGLDWVRVRVDCAPVLRELGVKRRSHLMNRTLGLALSDALGIDASDYGGWVVSEAADWVTEGPSLEGSPVDCVIITGADLAAEFSRLAEWHNRMGIRTVVRTVSWIDAKYPGADTPERIRNFLKDAYENWGTVYALLGGDPVIVPMRILYYDWLWGYTGATSDRIPVDIYYSNLDGNWNADGDEYYGESGPTAADGLDLYADICVGRAPVSSVEDAATFIDKTITYSRGLYSGDSYDRTIFMAQVISESPAAEFDGAEAAEHILSHFPGSYEKIRLYQNYEKYDGAIQETLENCIYYLNGGAGIVSHIGHGDLLRLNLGSEMMERWHVDSLSNDSTYYFMYMMNCASANPDVESIAKNFIRNPRGGAVALIGNQVFASPTNGLAMEEDFFRLLFSSENMSLGIAATIPRNRFATPDRNYPWWTYLNNILLGDPCIRIWEGRPDELDVSGNPGMTTADSVYVVRVENDGVPVMGAVAVLRGARGEYGLGVTDASGSARITFRPRGPGEAHLIVNVEGYSVYEGAIEVTGTGGRAYVSGLDIDDEDGGSYAGNGDGEAGWGERIGLGVGVTNGGSGTLSELSGSLAPVMGCSLNVNLEFDGPGGDPEIYVGRGCTSPPSVPFGVNAGGAVLGRCTRDLGEEKACRLWLDSRGWHFRISGPGDEPFDYHCQVEVLGEILGYGVGSLEPDDSLTVADGTLIFEGRMTEYDYEDGFDFQSGYDEAVVVHDASEDFGNVGSLEVVRYFDVEFSGGSGDRLPVWFELHMEDGSENVWYDWFPVVVGRGVPEVAYFSGFGGPSGDFEIAVRNAGSGGIKGLVATVRSIEGIVMDDSTAAYGDLASGEYGQAQTFTYTGSPVGAMLEVEFGDAFGTVWLDTLYERTLEAPGSVTYTVGGDLVELVWEAIDDDMLYGYEIHRADDLGGDETLAGIARGHSRFVDYAVAAEEDYFYSVRAVDVMGNTSEASGAIEVWSAAPYMQGFPAEIRGAAWASPVSGDADHDGLKEIFVGSRGQDVAAFDVSGNSLYGFPYICTCEVRSSPALADLDGDGTLECIFGIGIAVAGGSACTRVVALNHNGTYVTPQNNPLLAPDAPGWPQELAAVVRSAPAIYDLDDDGRPEVLMGTYGKVSGKAPLYAFRYDGTSYLAGDPVFAVCNDLIWTAPCVGDLDGNGKPEVIVTDIAGGIYIWKWDGGAYLADSTGLLVDAPAAFRTSAVMGDIDGDELMEIVTVNDWGQVYAFNHDGSPVGGGDGIIASFGGSCWSDPALADFDGDGALEITFGLNTEPGRIILIRGDGSAYGDDEVIFFYQREMGWSSPAIADLDEDGELEIVACSKDAYIYGLNADGTFARGFPLRIDGLIFASPLIDDLDMDGDMELVVVGYDARVHVWDLRAPYSEETAPWPMFHHDAWSTGVFGFQAPGDTLGPSYTVGVFQGTVVNRALDIFVAPAEYTRGAPEVRIATSSGNQDPQVEVVPNALRTYRAHYITEAAAAETIYVSATDLNGNTSTGKRVVTYSQVLNGEMVAASCDGVLEARFTESGPWSVIGILPVDPDYLAAGRVESPGMGPAYNICTFGEETSMDLVFQAGSDEAVYRFDGVWVQVDGQSRQHSAIRLPDAGPGIYALGPRAAPVEAGLILSLAGPNPFTGDCLLHIAGVKGEHVRVRVFDVGGRLVRTVFEGPLSSPGELTWDGCDGGGRKVSSGIYFVNAETTYSAISSTAVKVIYMR